MIAEANPLSMARFVREFSAVCAKHSVPYGSPDCLAGFLQALQDNKHLAMNFWSIVARMSVEHGGAPGEQDRALEAIVEGVTGSSVEALKSAGQDKQTLLNQLARMLAGEDLRSVLGQSAAPAKADIFESNTEYAEEKKRPQAFGTNVPTGSEAHEETETIAQIPFSVPETPPIVLSEDTRRLILKPEFATRPPSDWRLQNPHDDRPMVIPLAGYADTTPGPGMSRTAWGLIAVLVLIAAGLLGAHYSHSTMQERLVTSLRAGYSAARTSWNGQNQPQPAPAGGQGGTAAATTAASNDSPLQTMQSADTENPADSVASAPAKTPSTGLNAAQNTATRETAAQDAAQNGAPVEVPTEVMTAHLISSRVPVYPEIARANQVQGWVVMQAIVTKEGTVGHLHVIGGNPLLVNAATEAVSTWQFRPYLVNGVPAEVSTTISVDVRPGN